jgi:hypothetical protein
VRTLTDDLLDILRADGSQVGDGDGTGFKHPPFRVLYPLGQTADGTHADPYDDLTKRFQVTCEGTTREQAEWWADHTDAQLLASGLVAEILPRPEVRRDDTTAAPSRWKAWPRYAIRTYRQQGA